LPTPHIAPNPAHNTLYIDAKNPKGFLADALGRQVLAIEGNKVDVSTLPKGTYMLHVQGMSPVRVVKE
jgi:hypothetical protein